MGSAADHEGRGFRPSRGIVLDRKRPRRVHSPSLGNGSDCLSVRTHAAGTSRPQRFCFFGPEHAAGRAGGQHEFLERTRWRRVGLERGWGSASSAS